MYFDIVGEIAEIEAIAAGPSVRDRQSLREQYGEARWRKLKGVATVRTAGGRLRNAEVHWYEAHGVGRRRYKIKRFLEPLVMEQIEMHARFVVCTHNEGCDDLDRRKIYQVIRDEEAAIGGYLRVIDDSGEDYLYPADYFVEIELPDTVEEALRLAS